MPYLGRPVTNAGQFEIIDDISSSFNGSNTSFTLQVGGTNIQPDSANVTIALDGIIQIPPTAYSITGSTLNFSEAPESGTGFHGVLAGQSQFIESDFITDTHIKSTANISGSKINTDFSAQTVQAKIFSGMVSSSAQIATDISGSFNSTSSSLASRVTVNEGRVNQGVKTTDSPTFTGGTITGDFSVGGTITAQEVHTEFESASILFTSGSTQFGNSSDDVHNMTGSLNISGSLFVKDGTLTVTDNVDFNGDLDVDGTTNLDAVDIDGNVDIAGTITQAYSNSSGTDYLDGDAGLYLANAGSDGTMIKFGDTNAGLVYGGSGTGTFKLMQRQNTTLSFDASRNATFAGDLTIENSIPLLYMNDISGKKNNQIIFQSGSTNIFRIGTDITTNDGTQALEITDGDGNNPRLSIDSSGNSTFGGEVLVDSYFSLRTTDDQANRWLLYTHTDDTFRINYNGSGNDELTMDTSGNTTFGGNITQSKAGNLRLTQTATGTGEASLHLHANNSTGDSFIRFQTDSTTFAMGFDNSDGDKWILSVGSDPHSDSIINIQPDGSLVTFDKAVNINNTLAVSPNGAKLSVGAAAFSSAGTAYDFVQIGHSAGFFCETADAADRNAFIGNNMYHNGSNWRTLYEDQVSAIQFRAGEIRFNTAGVTATSSNLTTGGGDTRFKVTADGKTQWGTYTGNGSTEGVSLEPYGNGYLYASECDVTSAQYHLYFLNGNGNVGRIETTSSQTNYVTSSDYRLKTNQVSIKDGLLRLNKLKPYEFNFKADLDTKIDGFFAHEVQEILPYAVSGEKDAVDENGEMIVQGLDNSKLVPLLVAAVQELSAKIEALES